MAGFNVITEVWFGPEAVKAFSQQDPGHRPLP